MALALAYVALAPSVVSMVVGRSWYFAVLHLPWVFQFTVDGSRSRQKLPVAWASRNWPDWRGAGRAAPEKLGPARELILLWKEGKLPGDQVPWSMVQRPNNVPPPVVCFLQGPPPAFPAGAWRSEIAMSLGGRPTLASPCRPGALSLGPVLPQRLRTIADRDAMGSQPPARPPLTSRPCCSSHCQGAAG